MFPMKFALILSIVFFVEVKLDWLQGDLRTPRRTKQFTETFKKFKKILDVIYNEF